MECTNVSTKAVSESLSKCSTTSWRLVTVKAVVFSVVMVFASSPHTYAATCTGFGSVLKTTWEELYNVAHPIGQEALKFIPVVGQSKQARNAISEASEKFHKFVFTDNRQSWTTVGARALPVLEERTKQSGNLVKAGVGGVRTFTTSGMLWDKVEIEIQKLDGRAKTDITVCTWDMESGAKNEYAEYTFPNGKNTSKKKFTINNVYGKSISIKLRNRSVANTFKYSIKTKGFLDISKQKTRAQNNAQKHARIN